jgi:hypothetical protein
LPLPFFIVRAPLSLLLPDATLLPILVKLLTYYFPRGPLSNNSQALTLRNRESKVNEAIPGFESLLQANCSLRIEAMQAQKPTSGTSMQHSQLADSILVQQALAGDQDAFETLVHRYETALFQMISRYVGEYHEARDVLQQVLLQLSLAALHLRAEIGP